ncbi:GTPase [Sinosporangium siamense]|uniref:Uncharacterized protein n=1 Tax=Sinosporangium siamense TaxID=1367973 RepID=A0A919V343_9ACTN|nr:GTPase [Sinosporangium siamense]GII90585.1 hypothetical protein Ssi02_08160 [Sinosporangium siamense]
MSDEGSGRDHTDIAMWGAPGSGKTTLLAALSIALSRRPQQDWRIVGGDAPSTDFLIQNTLALSGVGEFPEATKDRNRYRWTLLGPPAGKNGRRRGKPAQVTATRININLMDPPGGSFGDSHHLSTADKSELISSLEKSKGIIFLFDPIREFEKGDAFNYLFAPLSQLASQMLASSDKYPDGKLPHHLAICITKFDELRVLQTASELTLLTTDPDDVHQFPRVPQDDAAQLLQELCSISATGNADIMLNTLTHFFHEDRIKYYVTSSIGFYLDPMRKVFDMADPVNLVPHAPLSSPSAAEPMPSRIRGQVHPINVVEPVLWLGQQVLNEHANGSPAG